MYPPNRKSTKTKVKRMPRNGEVWCHSNQADEDRAIRFKMIDSDNGLIEVIICPWQVTGALLETCTLTEYSTFMIFQDDKAVEWFRRKK